MKKKAGNGRYVRKIIFMKLRGLSQFVSALMALAVLFTFFIAMINQYDAILAENDIHRINRKYLLVMEKEGYLTAAHQNALVTELTNYGATNINLTGSSISKVGYGNRVVLHIECDIPISQINMSGLFGQEVGGIRHVVVEKDGTALY